MAIIPAQMAISSLISSAEQGEIDPWDVPVIEVIDRFLYELGLMDTSDISTKEANLPQSGQAFLWASMLVLLKADTLKLLQDIYQEDESEDDFLNDFEFEDQDLQTSLPPFLEQHLRRRTSVPPKEKRKVSLQELIEQLEQIAAEIEAATTGEKKPKRTITSRRAAMKAIANLAHNENLTELAIQLEHYLRQVFPKLSSNQGFLNWELLLTHWHQDNYLISGLEKNPDNHSGNDRAGVFWALLLLSAQSKVELSQEEFYQDLSIKPLLSL